MICKIYFGKFHLGVQEKKKNQLTTLHVFLRLLRRIKQLTLLLTSALQKTLFKTDKGPDVPFWSATSNGHNRCTSAPPFELETKTSAAAVATTTRATNITCKKNWTGAKNIGKKNTTAENDDTFITLYSRTSDFVEQEQRPQCSFGPASDAAAASLHVN